MKISSAQIAMTATHAQSVSHEVTETQRAWGAARLSRTPPSEGRSAVVRLSQASRDAAAASASATAATSDELDEAQGDPRLMLLKAIVEALTGKKIDLPDTSAFEQAAENGAAQAAAGPEWGFEATRRESYDEREVSTFNAAGVVRTADGKEIRFNVSLAMERSFHAESFDSVRAGNLKDPLVLNFAGNAAQLADTRMRFDLNGDGSTELMPLLAGGSAYLAFDRDGDGQITSGKELFGPSSGNGYAELSELDADANGFLDESDPAFEQLKLWSPSAHGAGQLSTLREHAVGALAVSHANTPFSLRSSANQTLGAVRATGVYLTEEGAVGTMQQLDLLV